MSELILAIPKLEHEERFTQMINEWKENQETIVPRSIDPKEKTYREWLQSVEDSRIREKCPPHFVPSSTYFLMQDEHIIGAVKIRHYLNEHLLLSGGHIGYGIRPSERRKGYATIMLQLALDVCQNMGIDRVLVTCDKENIASAKTIQANKGKLENEVLDHVGIMSQRYWIYL